MPRPHLDSLQHLIHHPAIHVFCFRRDWYTETWAKDLEPHPDAWAETSSWSGGQYQSEKCAQMLCSIWVEMASSIILLFCGPLRVLLGATGTVTQILLYCCNIKENNNWTKKALSEKWGRSMKREWSYCTASEVNIHPIITGSRTRKQFAKSRFSEWFLKLQSDGSEFPQTAFPVSSLSE